MVFTIIAFSALAAWCALALFRGGFWRCAERDDHSPRPPLAWPRIAVVVPARDEASSIGESLASVFRQDYRGPWSVILVDDDSRDGTAKAAMDAAAACQARDRLTIVSGAPLPRGWTGKLWALRQGIEHARAADQVADYLLLTDADIVYAPDVLEWLVAHAAERGDVLTSFMVKLRCESAAERFLVPAFVFFFQMLYPFGLVNRRGRGTAAAAGGCMLVRSDTLLAAGGIEAIRDALIDDCALARLLKAKGPIWLGLTERVASIRSYRNWSDVRSMITRSAYAQLGYSPLWLAGTVAAMVFAFVLPPVAAVFGVGAARAAGIGAWAVMALLFGPTLRLYRLSPLWGLALPAIGAAYMLFTVDSAVQSIRGKGGLWKGRFQAAGAKRRRPQTCGQGKGTGTRIFRSLRC
jgi:hopene-associated glycosyltransferase HpnB